MKRQRPASLPILQKGQLWKTKTAQVEIMQMGKLLVHYRRFVGGSKRVPVVMEQIRVVQDYLAANGGKLIKNPRLKILT